MRKTWTTTNVSAVTTAALAVMLAAGSPAHADLTGKHIIERCERAYASLKTYQGTTTIVSDNGSRRDTQVVKFVRPGKLRVVGTRKEWTPDFSGYQDQGGLQLVKVNPIPMYPNRGTDTVTQHAANRPTMSLLDVPFTFVSDGKNTWRTDGDSSHIISEHVITVAEFRESIKRPFIVTPSSAIESFTVGYFGSSAAMPAILLGAKLQSPFNRFAARKWRTETINRKRVYKVESSETSSNIRTFRTFWIDRITFLLVKMEIRTTNMEPADADAKQPQRLHDYVDVVTETYNSVTINNLIPASVFAPISEPLPAAHPARFNDLHPNVQRIDDGR